MIYFISAKNIKRKCIVNLILLSLSIFFLMSNELFKLEVFAVLKAT